MSEQNKTYKNAVSPACLRYPSFPGIKLQKEMMLNYIQHLFFHNLIRKTINSKKWAPGSWRESLIKTTFC